MVKHTNVFHKYNVSIPDHVDDMVSNRLHIHVSNVQLVLNYVEIIDEWPLFVVDQLGGLYYKKKYVQVMELLYPVNHKGKLPEAIAWKSSN